MANNRCLQYQIIYSEKWIPSQEAEILLQRQKRLEQSPSDVAKVQESEADTTSESDAFAPEEPVKDYERIVFHEKPFLCAVPRINTSLRNETSHALSKADQDKELARATDRGRELLREMEGKCMYYVSGWWSYSFCYNSQIKQYHHLTPGAGGPVWPPQEDPSTPAYILGRFSEHASSKRKGDKDEKSTTDVTALQTQGDTRYLVQHLSGGTICDLTGRERHIEVQFHCHPQSTDQIFTIKEVSTCSYLLVLYTPRLCNDVAFQPPQENKPYSVICREILRPEEVEPWEEEKMKQATDVLTKEKPHEPVTVGNIAVGAQKKVGRDGRKIEKGKIVKTPEEKAEIVAKKEGSKIHRLSKAELKKIDLDEATLESLREELQELAGTNDWRLEIVDAPNGIREIRGIVEADNEQEEPQKQKPKKQTKVKKPQQTQEGENDNRKGNPKGDL